MGLSVRQTIKLSEWNEKLMRKHLLNYQVLILRTQSITDRKIGNEISHKETYHSHNGKNISAFTLANIVPLSN